ncbi:MAG: DUF481 domain-containing protein [Planctomycetota bacterium]
MLSIDAAAGPTRPAAARTAALCLVTALVASCQLSGRITPTDGGDDIMTLPPADRPAPQSEPTLTLDDESDWIQLPSGEWLKGSVVRVRDRTLEFESDELGGLAFDFDDLLSVRTAEPLVLVTRDEKTLRGRLVLEEDDVWIEGEQTVRLDREEVLASIAADGGSAVDWSGGITAGAVTRNGNTKQTDFSLLGIATRETAQTRWTNTYAGAYSEAQGARTANNHRIRSVYDIFLTPRFFLTLPSIDVFRDEFQNIDIRITPSAQLGYEVVDTANHSWRVAAGPAYQYTKFDSAPAGEDDEDSSFAAIFSSFYTWDITADVAFGFDYQITAPIPDTDEYNHNLILRLGVDLINDLTFNVAFVWDRVNKPVADADGNVPVEDDYRTTIGLGWQF